ncbi:Uncharacterised protein [Mycobacterium tuberculosis]|nr:Uncharacterised protein [Mycobacterium tuberculosis]CPA28960.1 Uncharacterised protein [Mycobacterium tuberculosis]
MCNGRSSSGSGADSSGNIANSTGAKSAIT